MTRQELREDLEDIVRKVMREELRDILTEAVEVASRPGNVVAEEHHHLKFTTPDWVSQLKVAPTSQPVVAETQHPNMGNGNAIMGLLGATAKTMTGAELSNFS